MVTAFAKLFFSLLPDVLLCYWHPSGLAICAEQAAMLSERAEFRVDCGISPNYCRHTWCCPDEPVDGVAQGCAPAPECEGYWVKCPGMWTNAGTCE